MNRAVVVLDETGSMSGQETRVVTSLNEYVATLPKKTQITVFKFDSEHWTEFFSDKKKNWNAMTEGDYTPAAATPLYDAIGKAIRHAESESEDGDKVLLMIDTDGMENASQEFNQKQINSMVDKCKGKGWKFLFMSSGIDQKEADRVGTIGNSMGMVVNSVPYEGRVANYVTASVQTDVYFNGDGALKEDSFFDDDKPKKKVSWTRVV